MLKYKYRILLFTLVLVLIAAFNNCGKVQFNSAATLAASATGTPGTPITCDPNAFGSICSGSPSGTPPNNGAHGFFYNLPPITDPNGNVANTGVYSGQHLAANMSLLAAPNIIPNLSLYTTQINVPLQSWTQGFPGYPNLQEWFGVCYDGAWSTPSAGSYTFVSAVDDAVAIFIDGNLIGENDGGNISQTELALNTEANYNPNPVAFKPVTLAQGAHSIEILFYQAWPVAIENQIWVLPVGTSFTAGTTPPDSALMQLSSPINGVLNCPH